MKRCTMILAFVAAASVAAYFAMAQRPRDRDGRRAGRAAQQAPAKSGVVAEFNRNPNGDTDGLRLDDGTEVRFPVSAGEKVTGVVSLKDRVAIEGWTQAGESEIHAATIKNETSGKLVVVDRPPPEIAQSDERQPPGRPRL